MHNLRRPTEAKTYMRKKGHYATAVFHHNKRKETNHTSTQNNLRTCMQHQTVMIAFCPTTNLWAPGLSGMHNME
jgi:hypothetical protein